VCNFRAHNLEKFEWGRRDEVAHHTRGKRRKKIFLDAG
jgi:hypothetical protein